MNLPLRASALGLAMALALGACAPAVKTRSEIPEVEARGRISGSMDWSQRMALLLSDLRPKRASMALDLERDFGPKLLGSAVLRFSRGQAQLSSKSRNRIQVLLAEFPADRGVRLRTELWGYWRPRGRIQDKKAFSLRCDRVEDFLSEVAKLWKTGPAEAVRHFDKLPPDEDNPDYLIMVAAVIPP